MARTTCSVEEEKILSLLQRYGPMSGSQLALQYGMPQPSVRRVIHQLRNAGYNITYATGANALYALHQEPARQAPGDADTKEL